MRALLALAALALSSIAALAGTYADIDQTSTVTNIVVWDGVKSYPVQSGHQLVPYAPPAGIGSTWNGSVFSVPPVVSQVVSAIATPATQADVQALQALVPSLAPVQSVNAKTGAVTLPVLCRQATASPVTVSTVDGTASFTWPNASCAFAATPSCYEALIYSADNNHVFAQPVQTAIDSTHVVFTVTTAVKLLSISLGALTIWAPPPAGTTMNITCVAPAA